MNTEYIIHNSVLYCKYIITIVTEEMYNDKHNKIFAILEIACYIFI